MVTNDASMNSFKHKIMEEVCRLEWAGQNDPEHIDELVLKMIPGPKPEYRCCVYKEWSLLGHRNLDGDTTLTLLIFLLSQDGSYFFLIHIARIGM